MQQDNFDENKAGVLLQTAIVGLYGLLVQRLMQMSKAEALDVLASIERGDTTIAFAVAVRGHEAELMIESTRGGVKQQLLHLAADEGMVARVRQDLRGAH